MRLLTRPLALVILLVAGAFCGASLTAAYANSVSDGQTVFFRELTIGDGDEVHGDVDVMFGNVVCEDGGQIDGNVNAFFGSFVARDGCDVEGKVSRVFSNESFDAFGPGLAPWDDRDLFSDNRGVLKKLGWDVVVLVAFLLFPVRVRVALDRVERHPGLSFAAGSVALVAAIPIGVLLLLSILGIPLIPLEIAALFAGLWIGGAAVSLLIGRRLCELLRPHTTPSPLTALAVGLIVLTAAETLPIVGWAVTSLVCLVGLGAALLAFVKETSFRSLGGGFSSSPPPPGPPMNRPA
jgi:hypothetical protein